MNYSVSKTWIKSDHFRYAWWYFYQCRAIYYQSIARVCFYFFLVLISLIALAQGLVRYVLIVVLLTLLPLGLTNYEGYSATTDHTGMSGLVCESFALKGH